MQKKNTNLQGKTNLLQVRSTGQKKKKKTAQVSEYNNAIIAPYFVHQISAVTHTHTPKNNNNKKKT